MYNESSTSDKDSDDCSANFLKEWEEARNVLRDLDSDLHDLRKYGFTFITALLAAESLILPTRLTQPGTENLTDILPDDIKFAVLLVNLVLITALQFIDRNYQVIQGAASKRARVLEKILNLELTVVITQRFRGNKVQDFVTMIYLAFIGGVLVLGSFALYPNYLFILLLVIATIIAGYACHYMHKKSVKTQFPYGVLDWTTNKVQCALGEEIEIILTNLSNEEELIFPKGTTMWEIRKEGDTKALKTEKAMQEIRIRATDTYTWLWRTEKDLDEGVNKLEDGLYRLYRVKMTEDHKPDPDLKPLPITLRIKCTFRDAQQKLD